jgi:hypothetical protein
MNHPVLRRCNQFHPLRFFDTTGLLGCPIAFRRLISICHSCISTLKIASSSVTLYGVQLGGTVTEDEANLSVGTLKAVNDYKA